MNKKSSYLSALSVYIEYNYIIEYFTIIYMNILLLAVCTNI